MRRGFSIFLILFFGLGPLSATIPGSEDINLPPCCRRHGAHHCAMAMRMAAMMARIESGATPAFSAPLTCPYYPGPGATITTTPPAIAAAAAQLPAQPPRGDSLPAPLSSVPFPSPGRTHAGRGPPASKLS